LIAQPARVRADRLGIASTSAQQDDRFSRLAQAVRPRSTALGSPPLAKLRRAALAVSARGDDRMAPAGAGTGLMTPRRVGAAAFAGLDFP